LRGVQRRPCHVWEIKFEFTDSLKIRRGTVSAKPYANRATPTFTFSITFFT
jgi:hypothetical protein